MGGSGSGGSRPGSGRKPKTARERAVDGNAGHRKVVAHPSSAGLVETAPPPITEFDAPNDLTTDERNVWLELAPHAFTARTLTPATAFAFKLLCRNVLLERQYAQSVTDKGSANHRGLIQRVDAELLRFNLAPNGKACEMPEQPAKPVNPLAKYLA